MRGILFDERPAMGQPSIRLRFLPSKTENSPLLFFSTPLWLWALPAVTAAGAWAFWRGRHRPRPVPSIRLWRGLTETASARPRIIDPVWLLVFIAALLAAAALAQPEWTRHFPADLPSAGMEWTIRSLGASTSPSTTEAWVRLLDGSHLPERMTLSIETDAGREQHTLSLAQLKAGIPIALPTTAARATLSLHTQNATATAPPLAQQSFVRSAIGQSFALLGSAGADPALKRVFAIQPGARPGDPTIRPTILLLSDPATAPSELSSIDGTALIIAQSEVPLPGLTPGERLSANMPWTPVIPPDQNASAAMPNFVHLDRVHVAAFRAVALSPEWHILATVADKPWMAMRQQKKLTLIWLASSPTTETDWPKDPSFVLFFAEMASRALAQPAATTSARFIDWIPLNDSTPTPPQTSSSLYPLNAYLGIAAIVLLIAATALLVLRAHAPCDDPLRISTFGFHPYTVTTSPRVAMVTLPNPAAKSPL